MGKTIIFAAVLIGCSMGCARGSELDVSENPSKSEHQDTLVSAAGIQGSGTLHLLPLVFFTPETNWGAGAASVYQFCASVACAGAQLSTMQLLVAYTLRNQLLIYAPYEIVFSEARFRLEGEAGYYRYTYRFFGIGPATQTSEMELYDVHFPRAVVSLSRQLRSGFFVGARYWYDGYRITERSEGGILESEHVTGWQGGINSGFAASLLYDSRDHTTATAHGIYAEMLYHTDHPVFGSDFHFYQLEMDMRAFYSPDMGHTLAWQLYMASSGGEVPFQRLPLLGGPERMRGYIEGRFRDNHYMTAQAEYRMTVYRRWGTVVFGSAGQVASRPEDMALHGIRLAGGAGLRYMLDPVTRLNVRMDYGWTGEGGALYLTIGEAF